MIKMLLLLLLLLRQIKRSQNEALPMGKTGGVHVNFKRSEINSGIRFL